jgi:hypothetical protein
MVFLCLRTGTPILTYTALHQPWHTCLPMFPFIFHLQRDSRLLCLYVNWILRFNRGSQIDETLLHSQCGETRSAAFVPTFFHNFTQAFHDLKRWNISNALVCRFQWQPMAIATALARWIISINLRCFDSMFLELQVGIFPHKRSLSFLQYWDLIVLFHSMAIGTPRLGFLWNGRNMCWMVRQKW